jgi:hypothetical protein
LDVNILIVFSLNQPNDNPSKPALVTVPVTRQSEILIQSTMISARELAEDSWTSSLTAETGRETVDDDGVSSHGTIGLVGLTKQ